MLVLKIGKPHMTEGGEISNRVVIKTLREKEIYKYSGIFQADTIKKVKMKEWIKKEYLNRNRKLLVTKLYSRNHVKVINT